MPKLARNYDYQSYDNLYAFEQFRQRYNYDSARYHKNNTVYTPPRSRVKHNKKFNPIKSIVAVFALLFFLCVIMPFGFNHITKEIFIPTPYKNITTDMEALAFPANYLANSLVMNKPTFVYSASDKKAQMTAPKENVNTPSLHTELLYLMEQYPEIKPAIYVWNYETENYIDINADKTYSTASIIKIPVLIDLFKSIELGQIKLTDTIPLKEYFRTEGSGNIQYKASNSNWTINELAKRMITISDNSATNMLMTELGSMEDVNQSIRDWGLKNTQIKTWLPDLAGNNRTTAREMGQMLYNIDSNEKFLNEQSRNRIFEYMSQVKNDRLIQAGLGAGSTFLHKTGDIGSMLGDAGIVMTPNGKKYIVVILANRPHNNPKAAEFIVKASEIIYNYMVK